jgi:hypothetical protein
LFLEPERFDVAHLSAAWRHLQAELEVLRDDIFARRIAG